MNREPLLKEKLKAYAILSRITEGIQFALAEVGKHIPFNKGQINFIEDEVLVYPFSTRYLA
jgi:hypothetical protein